MVQALEKMEIEVSPIDFTDLKSNIIITEEEIRVKESLIMELGEKYVKEAKANELAELIKSVRPFLGQVSKAKAAKLVKSLIDMFLELEAGTSVSIQLCKECVDWATEENRTFLRQFLQARLISSYYESSLFVEALDLCASVLKELKKIDEKHLLVEVLLLESKSYHALNNLSKARASLTSARTTANSIYCPPTLQAYLDLQSGVLHAADEVDFKTAYSYFYEAFECFDSTEHKKSIVALKYMLLSKIMLGLPEDVNQIVSSGKIALKYDGRDIDAMKNIAKASKKRSLADFKETLTSYKEELENDPIVRAHLDTLYNNLLELNLCKIIEPYSRVEIEFVAKQIELPEAQVEKKLAHMLLDDKFSGILDQSERILVVYEESVPDKTYEAALETINSMSKVVDTLYEKAKKLN